jgi:hypothetical protein
MSPEFPGIPPEFPPEFPCRQQEISGESAAMAAQVLLDKWAARGLNPKVLAAVRTEVFDIVEPKT